MSEHTVMISKISGDAKLPSYAHEDDVGMDLYSVEELVIKPMERKLVGTGIKIELPKNIEAQVRPKSGLSAKFGLSVLNTPGTIDPGYRGEVKVIIINLGNEEYKIEKGSKIAQMVFNEIKKPKIKIVDELTKTKRGEGGFGSTGLM